MAADAELGVILKPKNNLEDELSDQEVAVGGAQGGGDLSPAQEQQQESVIAGGVSGALKGFAVIGAILSQLTTITGLVSAIFGTLSRALLPAVEVLSEIFRPLFNAINDFIANPSKTVGGAAQATQASLGEQFRDPFNVEGGDRSAARRFRQERGTTAAEVGDAALDTITSFIGFGPQSADQTGEAAKQQATQNFEDAKKDKTGASK